MHTDQQLFALGFHRPRPRQAGFTAERHLIVGGWKPEWPDAITRNSRKPRLIIRGRFLFVVPNAVWREMNRYGKSSPLYHRHYFKVLWETCSRFWLPMCLSDLKLFIESVQTGDWIEPDFYSEN